MSHDGLRAFFNEKASFWDEVQKVEKDKIRSLLRHLPIPLGGVILDVGSGTGVLIPFLRELFAPSLIVELDIAEEMLAVARKKFGDRGIEYVLADAENVSFDTTFDAILCYSSFPHFEDKEKTVVNLLRSMKDGGVFAVLHSSGRDCIHAIHALHEVTKDHHLPPGNDLASLFERLGLEVFCVVDSDEEYLVAGVKAAEVRAVSKVESSPCRREKD
ncbi:MAG: class I SAM-dependent methyltransferase [Candidatus Caldatribacteriaceae bacterium]